MANPALAPGSLRLSYLASIVVPFLSTNGLQELILTWGYGVVFMAMLLESAGLPLPGETIPTLAAMRPAVASCRCWG